MSLTNELIKGLLSEEENKQITAVYAGGFKPPTGGHFEVVEQALKQNPEIDEFIIFIGNKERNGISQEESLLIWEIYNNYLPFKVKIEPTSKPPIKAVYNFASDHPTREVLWVIGAREGNEEDFKDITSRTKSISKYPNLELRTIITSGGVSGTAARNASKISLDKFKKFVPDVLSDKETEEVYNIVADKISENKPQDGKAAPYGSGYDEIDEKKDPKKGTGKKPKGSKRRLYTDEDPKDTIGIKFSTRQDIVDTLNKKSFKAKSHARQSQIINLIHQRVRAAYGRSKKADVKKRLKTGLDYITKKKEASKKKTQRLKKLKENASYSQYIDIQDKIDQLTQHMINKGMNIKPLPSLEFVDSDSENAKDFFGKTAYYDPNRQHIVLYTEGRHPKDIVRSYAHEMIHHIQYLENRLGDISGTDTTSSDHLTKLEKEANLRGTMTFRNWTDSILNEAIVGEKIECDNCGWSWNIVDGGDDLFICHKCGHDNEPINEKKNKDPFGLNAYARELALLREEEGNYKIYLDMDGVIADFNTRFKDLSGIEPREFESKYGRKAFWDFIDEENKIKFWVGIPPMPGASELVSYISKHDYEILTAPSIKEQSRLGKNLWVRNHVGDIFPSKPKVTFKFSKEKHKVKQNLSQFDILIDDRQSIIDNWNNAGGFGILYQSTPQAIADLKKLGL